MIWRNIQALRVLRKTNENQSTVIDHIGFILISLFEGFAIVSAIDLKVPAWLIGIIAIGAVGVGIFCVNLLKGHLRTKSNNLGN